MVTRLKCSELEENEKEDEELEYEWGDVENDLTPSDLLYLLIHTEATEENKDERFCLAMVILIESLVIPRYIGFCFPKKVLKIAQNLETLMSYPWGDSYMIQLNSVKKIVPTRLGKPKYDIHGFPLSLNLWMLESVPQLQSSFSSLNTDEPPTSFLCEKYLRLMIPVANQVVMIEGYRDLKVVCVVPFIQNDPEDTVFLEDNPDEHLDNLVDIVTNGYKTIDVMEAMDQQSHRFGVAARSRPSNAGAGPSNDGAETSDESLMTKLDNLYNMIQNGLSDINNSLSNIEKKMGFTKYKTDGVQQNASAGKSPPRDVAQAHGSTEEVRGGDVQLQSRTPQEQRIPSPTPRDPEEVQICNDDVQLPNPTIQDHEEQSTQAIDESQIQYDTQNYGFDDKENIDPMAQNKSSLDSITEPDVDAGVAVEQEKNIGDDDISASGKLGPKPDEVILQEKGIQILSTFCVDPSPNIA
ncbi:hypothetical protein EUTSA_v10002282mg, partial [Eutrema salsugineum]